MQRFCRFLAEQYHLEKLANVAPKHLYAYVAHMKETGKSTSTIKTDLSAIRFYHDQIPNPRRKLPGNSVLDIERRSIGGTDRTWSEAEFSGMVQIAEQMGRKDYVAIFHLLGRIPKLHVVVYLKLCPMRPYEEKEESN